jgi:hypothetical protein
MKEDLASARRHPAALASIVIASLAVTALALVTIAYLVGWIPTHGVLPGGPGSIATPGQQLSGTVPGGVDLLPGETLVAPAETPAAALPGTDTPKPDAPGPEAAKAPAPLAAPTPAIPRSARPAPLAAPARPAAPVSSRGHAQTLPSRAAPSKPDYNREPPAVSAARELCVNCGTIASIGSDGADWEVRVRFEDGSTETLRYPDRPRLRLGERVHLEDGRLVPE